MNGGSRWHRQNGGDVCSKESTPLKGSSRRASERVSGRPRESVSRKRKAKERCTSFIAVLAAVLAMCIGVALFLTDTVRGWYDTFQDTKHDNDKQHQQEYDEIGRYIVDDYDTKPAFADFLPGLAGIYGKPLYAFYTNRGQGIASFGVKSKDYPIMEFQSAKKAYQSTALVGFRTFLQGSRGTQHFLTEPFGALTTRFPNVVKSDYTLTPNTLAAPFYLPKRTMYIGRNEVQIREVDTAHKIETNVSYFVLPEEDFGAFVRRVTIVNTDNRQPLVLSALDGLARMEPAGGKLDGYLKDMGNTLEGFMNVFSPYNNTQTMPFYRVTSQPSDTEATTAQIAGHYCLAMIEGEPQSQLLPIIYDPSTIFGDDTSLIRPIRLMSRTVRDIIAGPQYGAAKTPSAFAAVDSKTLKPGESVTITSFYGKAAHIMDVPVVARRIQQPGFGQYKQTRLREIVRQITAQIETKTANKLFDGYVKQMFLDSSLNGGVPTLLGEVDDDALMRSVDEDERLKVYHLFSRIHGDLERDYNDFEVSPTFFSEGPGRFNDLAQHRRNDVFFAPRVGSFNVRLFLSLLQADGYNPLTVESVSFTISNKIICNELAAAAVGQADGHRAQREKLSDILNGGPFRPGQLFELMAEANMELIIPIHTFIDRIAAASEIHPMGVFGSGFWADQFSYFMDFIESYLEIYPDQEERLLFNEKLKFFYSPASVRPRNEKYVVSVSFSGNGKHIRQLDAVAHDQEKVDYQMRYFVNTTGRLDLEANWQHDSNGNIFQSTVVEKLILLATLKFSTRCPYGMSIEYEAGKPGYNSAMNGIPSMIGSGVAEAYELLRLLRYLSSVVNRFPQPIQIPVELFDLLMAVNKALEALLQHADLQGDSELSESVPTSRFEYWDRVASSRESYRERVRVVFDGETKSVGADFLQSTLDMWIKEVVDGLDRASHFGSRGEGDDGSSGLPPTYFSYNVTKWKKNGELNSDLHPFANASAMVMNRFPLFLEGPTRMMQTSSPADARKVYSRVRASHLRDKNLGMYKLSGSLNGQSRDIGRATAFAPGWLENESIWMEMSYKFYFQLLDKNMVQEFFGEMLSGGLLPFMDPSQYGRSLMECSAFLASSAFEDPSKHGRGFYARLTGATSEFLRMWVRMMIGKKPFFVVEDTGELRMQLLPSLPKWLFLEGQDQRNSSEVPSITFKLFGSIQVSYHNERRDDLVQIPPYRYVVGYRDGSTFEVQGATIPFGLADKIRRVVFVASIDVYYR
ncbi:expressed unknown protein [Seminavis robusta]|uniref:Uncharacterized protein n=1 Tax=Seminavis robusta TaxID=568900 RepID=A0A9N8E7T7_9STRA|nr:expressed unknown protein [Seminavis robusta]|eukprot:Sro637_g179470.1 n/a (1251) ;mRNA; r:45538-49786